jgi:hypothetical protein
MDSQTLTNFVNTLPDLEISDSNVKTISQSIFDAMFENSNEIKEKFIICVENFFKVLDINNDGKIDLIQIDTNDIKDIKDVNIELGTDLEDFKDIKNLLLSDNPNAIDILTTSLSLMELYFTDDHYSDTLDEINDFINSIKSLVDIIEFDDDIKNKDDIIRLVCMVCVLVLPIQKLLKDKKKLTKENINKYVTNVYGSEFRVNFMMRLMERVSRIISSRIIVLAKNCWCC